MSALWVDLPSLVLTAGGILFGLVLTVVVVRRHRSLAHDASRLMYLALDGRPEEARVEARNSPRRLAPVLAALSGSLEAPQARRFTSDLLGVVMVFAAPVALAAYVPFALQSGDFDHRSQTLAAGIAGFSLLLPVSTLCAALMIAAARRSARSVRGSCLMVLAKTARSEAMAQVATALRQGGLQDPRNA